MGKKKSKMNERWVEFYTNTSLNGFHFIFDSKRYFMRMLWIIIMLSALALGVMLFFGAIYDFLSYKTTTSYEEVLSSTEVKFPTVTICNMNSVSERKVNAKSLGLPKENIIKFYEDLHNGKLDAASKNNSEILKAFKQNNITDLNEIFSFYEYNIAEVFREKQLLAIISEPCKFCDKVCNISDFNKIVSSTYGVCYQFNSISSKRNSLYSRTAGEGGGLRVYLHFDEDDLIVSNVPFHGLQVYIHPFGEPFESALSKRIPVGPGKMSFIHINLKKIELLPSPYPSKCSELEYVHVKKSLPYSQSMCEVDCAVNIMLQECGCIAVEMEHHIADKSKICGVDQLTCIDQLVVQVQRILHECKAGCPRQCQSIRYDLVSGETSMASTRNLRKLMVEFNRTREQALNHLQQHIFGLDITFSDIVYGRESLEAAQNWITLLSQIGGSLGLALGASAITIVEFIIFALQMLRLYFKGDGTDPNKNKQNGVSNNKELPKIPA